MFIKQLSVFIENRSGRLEQVTQTLKENNINIVSISLADTSDYGLLRLILSDPDTALKVLKENGFSATITNVVAVKVAQQVGQLSKLLSLFSGAGIDIEYMYSLASGAEEASIVFKTSNPDKAVEVINNSDFSLLTSQETYNI